MLLGFLLFTFLTDTLLICLTSGGGSRLHNTTLARVIEANVSFFRKTPLQHLMAPFSRDIGRFDSAFQTAAISFYSGIYKCVVVAILVVPFDPYLIIAEAVVLVLLVLQLYNTLYVLGLSKQVEDR